MRPEQGLDFIYPFGAFIVFSCGKGHSAITGPPFTVLDLI
jgi:hypothetical protein